MAKALSQPNSRSDGRSENTVTASPQASTTEVRISAGPTSTVARSTPIAGILARLFLQPQAVEEVDRRAQAEPERHGQRHDAGELQALAHHPQHACRTARSGRCRQDADQHHDERAEGEADERRDEDDLDRQRRG